MNESGDLEKELAIELIEASMTEEEESMDENTPCVLPPVSDQVNAILTNSSENNIFISETLLNFTTTVDLIRFISFARCNPQIPISSPAIFVQIAFSMRHNDDLNDKFNLKLAKATIAISDQYIQDGHVITYILNNIDLFPEFLDLIIPLLISIYPQNAQQLIVYVPRIMKDKAFVNAILGLIYFEQFPFADASLRALVFEKIRDSATPDVLQLVSYFDPTQEDIMNLGIYQKGIDLINSQQITIITPTLKYLAKIWMTIPLPNELLALVVALFDFPLPFKRQAILFFQHSLMFRPREDVQAVLEAGLFEHLVTFIDLEQGRHALRLIFKLLNTYPDLVAPRITLELKENVESFLSTGDNEDEDTEIAQAILNAFQSTE